MKTDSKATHQLVAALLRLSQIIEADRLSSALCVGLSSLQVQILGSLATMEFGAPISYFARRMGISVATVSDSVRVLESKGLVTKTRSAADARSVGVAITNRGRESVGTASIWQGTLSLLVAGWEDHRQSELYPALLELIVGLREQGFPSTERACVGCRHLAINCDVGESAAPHYCRALNIRMRPLELRLDCAEFSAAE